MSGSNATEVSERRRLCRKSVTAEYETAHKNMARVLIVDDDPETCAVLASDLEQDKHVVVQAGGVSRGAPGDCRQSL